MVTGASTADLALLLVDARKGVLEQTRRHSILANLVGIRRMVLAVTKMDLVDFDRDLFDAIVADYRAFAEQIGIADWIAIPVSGLTGDNVAGRGEAMGWYQGPTLLEHLESVPIDSVSGRGQAVPHAGSMGQPARPAFPRFRRADRDRPGRAGRRGAHPALGPDRPGSTRIVTLDGDLGRSGRRPVGHADARPRRSTARAATSSPRPRTRRTPPTSSKRPSSGWPTSR